MRFQVKRLLEKRRLFYSGILCLEQSKDFNICRGDLILLFIKTYLEHGGNRKGNMNEDGDP